MSSAAPSQFVQALVADLAAVIEAMSGSRVPVSTGTGIAGGGWILSLSVTGSLRGTVRLTFDAEGVTALLRLVLGLDADTSDGAATDLLRELAGQAISSPRLKEAYTKAAIAIDGIEPGAVAADQTMLFALGVGECALEIAASASLEAMVPIQAPAADSAAPRPAAKTGMTSVPSGNLDVVLDIELPLSIRFGSTSMSIRSLSTLGPGSIVDMGRSPDDPVEVLVCGRVIARAEVVIVGGNYGIRITDLTSAADRIRAMEGTW